MRNGRWRAAGKRIPAEHRSRRPRAPAKHVGEAHSCGEAHSLTEIPGELRGGFDAATMRCAVTHTPNPAGVVDMADSVRELGGGVSRHSHCSDARER